LKYNRPDKVLDRLKCTNIELMRSLQKAYEKRLQKSGIKEENLDDQFHAPDISINNILDIPLNSSTPKIVLDVSAYDNKVKIKGINVYINDVPQCGTYKVDTKTDDANYVEKEVEVKLMNGRNRITVSCINAAGAESRPQEMEVNYTDTAPGKVYFIGIAVADYKNTDFNLKYTVKDIRDLASALKKKYPDLIVDTLLNAMATRENILKLKQNLLHTNVNDKVIMAISGHGLLSKSLDFYYATYDVDFHNPSVNGIKYEDIEGLYDCIAARRKLLLLDACHSGEVDRDGNLMVKDVLPDGVKENRTKGSQLLESTDNISLNNSFELMQQVFANLSKGNGSIVISAAGGQEYALESDKWANGVFTYCVLQALLYDKADLNNDKKTTIGELKKYVSAEVQKLTAGRQKPTNRRENLLFDWEGRVDSHQSSVSAHAGH
jgi:ribosomal protein L24